ncbi:MAG: helix-turn-helix domain-containing protein [Elusimicrobia bacterium]|nr:helix-turn-helix domain-containing protein [Elusimicrobiota bacterium]
MSRDIYNLLGDRIREERKRAGLTLEKLAELAGISTSFLAYIETKGRKASLKTVEKLAKALRIPIAELFKTIPGPEKDAVHDAAMGFAQLIREKSPAEIKTALEVAKAALKGISNSKKDKS